jgi:glucose-1-phosphate cytidylyltransferase
VKTVILCGGKGSRLGAVGDQLPKTLLLLNGKPCLQYIVENYMRKGYREFVLCVGHHGDQVIDFCRRHLPQASFDASDAGGDASMLERLHHARGFIGDRAWVAYGDTLVDVDLADMLAGHEASGAALTLTTAHVQSPFGLVESDPQSWLLSFREKPVQPYFVGHMLIERSVLDGLDAQQLSAPDGAGLVNLIQRLVGERRVRTHAYSGPQITFNTQNDLDRAEREIEFFTQTERKGE